MKARSIVLVIAGLSAACGTPSQVDPDARVQVSGTVVDATGTSVPGARAVLTKEVGFDEFLSGATTMLTTWGFACAIDEPVDPCGEYAHTTSTDGAGAFAFALQGSDVQSGFGTVSTMTATVAAPPGPGELTGAAVSLGFQVQEEMLTLPPLRLWQPNVDLAVTQDTFSVSWPAMPEGYPAGASYQAVVTDDAGWPVWTSPSSGDAIDLRILEDIRGGVAVQATASTTVDGRDTEIIHRSAQRPLEGPGAPPSRGAACLSTADGYRPVLVTACPLTDGDFARTELLDTPSECASANSCDHPLRAVSIDLGSIRGMSLLVIRGDEDDFVVEVSDDGSNWREITTVEMGAEHVAVPLPGGTSGRYIRLRAPRSNVGALAEVSVW